MHVSAIRAWLHSPMHRESLSCWWHVKRTICWRDYLFAGLLAYLLPFLALAIEWYLTKQNQLSLARHFGPPKPGDIMEGMTIPALVSYLVFLPLLRYPVRCGVVAVLLCVVWIIILLSGEAAVH